MALRRLGRWAPAAVIVLVAAAVGAMQLNRDDEPEPLAVESSAEMFDSLDELVAASDLVVVATVTEIADGRTITSPSDPDAGIHTRLVELDVTDVLHGDAPASVVTEEAESFADGTPIVLDRMTELSRGDEALWFLVAGGTEAMPYYAATNSQSRFLIAGNTLQPSGDDPLSRELAALGGDGLAGAVRSAS